MYTQASTSTFVDSSLYTFMAQFYTDHLIVHAELTSPEIRLSAHLNSSLPAVEVRPSHVDRIANGASIELDGSYGPLTKHGVLFVVPIAEPARPEGTANFAWKQTMTRRCWLSLGRHSLTGTIHMDVNRDARIALRLLEKKFIALTDVSIASPHGDTQDYRAVLVNREQIALLALRDD